MKILLLEDDVMIASGVKYALENEGYEVEHAMDVSTAKNLISGSAFSLAIIDMQLPDGNGLWEPSLRWPRSTQAQFLLTKKLFPSQISWRE